jgi:hypothetical protein
MISMVCSLEHFQECQAQIEYVQNEATTLMALAEALVAMSKRTPVLHGLSLLLKEHLGYLQDNADDAQRLVDCLPNGPRFGEPTEGLHVV